MKLNSLINFLPYEFKDQDTYKVDGKGILERYLEIFGDYFQDIITEDTKNLLDIIDIDTTPAYYLNYLWEFLGELPFANTPDISQETWESYFSGFKDDATMEQLCNQWLNYRTGILEFDTDTVRKLLKCSIALFKIRGTKQFFEILFRLYGLGLTITDPVNDSTNLWIPDDHPNYDLEDMNYDKNITYDNLYRCTQCVEVPIVISGHGFTSVTDEFLSFKQSIDNLFRRFLPYNARPSITYHGVTMDYNYQIEAVPQNGTTLLRGQVEYIEILVTVTAYGGYKDADLRYEVSGDGVNWSSTKYNSPSIYLGKREGTLYFRCVADTSAIATVVITRKTSVQGYSIQLKNLFNNQILGSNPEVVLPTWEENQSTLPIEVTGFKYINGELVSNNLLIRRIDTNEIKASPATWDLKDGGTYTFNLVDYPQRYITLTVVKEDIFTIICNPTSVFWNPDRDMSTLVTVTSLYEDPDNLQVALLQNGVQRYLGLSPYRFTPINPGIYYFVCPQDPSENKKMAIFQATQSSILVILALSVGFKSGVYTTNNFDWGEDVRLNGEIRILLNFTQLIYDYQRENLDNQLATGVLEIWKDGIKLDTIPYEETGIGVDSTGYMAVTANYIITQTGTYQIKYTINGRLVVSQNYYVTQSTQPEEVRLIIIPIVSTATNNGWSTSSGIGYDDDSEAANEGYSELTFTFDDVHTKCQFYLQRADNLDGTANSTIESGQVITLGEEYPLEYTRDNIKNGDYVFTLVSDPSVMATLHISKPAPQYTLIADPAEIVMTSGQSVAETTLRITMNPVDTSGEYTYNVDVPGIGVVDVDPVNGYIFKTQLAGTYVFTVVDTQGTPKPVTATFTVKSNNTIHPDSLEWESNSLDPQIVYIETSVVSDWTATITTTP